MAFTSPLTILDRYLLKEFLGPFCLAVMGFTIIGIVDILFSIVDLTILSGIHPGVTIRLLFYKLPAVFILFFPMAVLFAIMLLLIRMAKDNEITVLRASGIHLLRMAIPLIMIGTIVSVLAFSVNDSVVPWANHRSEQLIQREIERRPPPNIVDNVVFKDTQNRFFYIKKMDTVSHRMSQIIVFEDNGQYPRILQAEIGQWKNFTWILDKGRSYEFDTDGSLLFSNIFETMEIHVDQDIQTYFSQQKTAREMDSKELNNRIKALNSGGISTRALAVEYHLKKSIPTACLIFCLVGIAYCFSFVRSGKDWWGVILAICVAVLSVGFYFFIVAMARALAKDGQLSPFLGAWLANGLYASISSLAILYQTNKK
jgi:lipopolysaccharide export system permease protein